MVAWRALLTTSILIMITMHFSCTAQHAKTLNTQAAMQDAPSLYMIEKATFNFATIGLIGVVTEDGKFCWSMDINAEEGNYEGNAVAPKFSFTELKESEDFKFNNSFAWDKVPAYEEAIDDWVGSFYVFDAHDFEVAITLEKKDDKLFHIILDGKVNLNWSTVEATNYRNFRIEKTLPFNGILSEINDEEKTRAIVAKFLDMPAMKWRPIKEGQEDSWLIH